MGSSASRPVITPSSAPTTIVLFGATGRTGHHFLTLALERGHTVYAYVRSEDKLRQQFKQYLKQKQEEEEKAAKQKAEEEKAAKEKEEKAEKSPLTAVSGVLSSVANSVVGAAQSVKNTVLPDQDKHTVPAASDLHPKLHIIMGELYDAAKIEETLKKAQPQTIVSMLASDDKPFKQCSNNFITTLQIIHKLKQASSNNNAAQQQQQWFNTVRWISISGWGIGLNTSVKKSISLMQNTYISFGNFIFSRAANDLRTQYRMITQQKKALEIDWQSWDEDAEREKEEKAEKEAAEKEKADKEKADKERAEKLAAADKAAAEGKKPEEVAAAAAAAPAPTPAATATEAENKDKPAAPVETPIDASILSFTLLLPPILTNGALTATYNSGTIATMIEKHQISLLDTVTRPNLAHLALTVAENHQEKKPNEQFLGINEP